jgi:hypothetical protein
MSEFEDRDGNVRPASWFGKHGQRPYRMDGMTNRELRGEERMSTRPEECPESSDGKHELDPHTVQTADVDAGEGCVVDVSCKHCGRSGAFKIEPGDVDW